MHDLYMAKIYRPGAIFLPLIVLVYLYSCPIIIIIIIIIIKK